MKHFLRNRCPWCRHYNTLLFTSLSTARCTWRTVDMPYAGFFEDELVLIHKCQWRGYVFRDTATGRFTIKAFRPRTNTLYRSTPIMILGKV